MQSNFLKFDDGFDLYNDPEDSPYDEDIDDVYNEPDDNPMADSDFLKMKNALMEFRPSLFFGEEYGRKTNSLT